MFGNADELFKFIKDEGVEYLDVRFTDLPGIQQQVTLPASTFDAGMVESGVAFDGSSIRGFQTIDQSDMVLFPDIGTAYLDPFKARKTHRDGLLRPRPDHRRGVLPRSAQHRPQGRGVPRHDRHRRHRVLRSRGRVLHLRPGQLRHVSANKSFYEIQSSEAAWQTSDSIDDNRGYQVRYKGGYFPVAPTDQTADLRNDMMTNLTNAGLTLERGHHEVGTAGQAEINYKFDTLLKAADDVMKFKYIVRNTAWANDKTVTFMPKPIFGDNGSGMHVHQSIWNDGEPLFYDESGYGGLSDLARHYIGGILKHAPSLLAFTNPSVNSYHRLVPGFEAPDRAGLLGPQPLGVCPHPDHGIERQGQAHRVPLPRPVGQPVPRLLGAAAGRHRRHQEQDRAARSDRQEHLRAAAGGVRSHRHGADLAQRGARLARGRSRVPHRR